MIYGIMSSLCHFLSLVAEAAGNINISTLRYVGDDMSDVQVMQEGPGPLCTVVVYQHNAVLPVCSSALISPSI